MSKENETELANNRRAFHDYEILDTLEAGISLVGTEVKSLREHGASLQDSYVLLKDREAWLKNATISPFKFGNIHNHPEKRDRKLLLHKRELQLLRKSSELKGLTIIPLAMYFKNGKVKVKIAIARGKKTYDKRAALKEKDEKKSIDRAMKDSR